MNKITPKKFEKVDDHTVRVIAEKIDDIDLGVLLKNRDLMLDAVKQLEDKLQLHKDKLEQIQMLITEAEKLGIVPIAPKPDVKITPNTK